MTDEITKDDIRMIQNMLMTILLEQNGNSVANVMRKIHKAKVCIGDSDYSRSNIFDGDITVLLKKGYTTPPFGR